MTNSLSDTTVALLVEAIGNMQRQSDQLEALETRLEALQRSKDESTKEA